MLARRRFRIETARMLLASLAWLLSGVSGNVTKCEHQASINETTSQHQVNNKCVLSSQHQGNNNSTSSQHQVLLGFDGVVALEDPVLGLLCFCS